MDLGQILNQAWELLIWFGNFVFATVGTSIMGGWSAVMILAAVAGVLFVLTRAVYGNRSRDDD